MFISLKNLSLIFLIFVVSVLILTGCHHPFEPYNSTRYDDHSHYNDNVSNSNYIATATFNNNLIIRNQRRFSLNGINGNVSIRGIQGSDSIIITGEKKCGSESYRDAESHLDDCFIQIQDYNNEISVKTIQPQTTYGRQYTVNYTILVPDYMQVDVNVTNSSAYVEKINNTVTINNINGFTSFYDINGSTYAVMMNGQIECKQTLPINGIILFSNINGNIILNIPTNTSADISAKTVNGSVKYSNMNLRDVTQTQSSLKGISGNGQAKITLTTINGSIGVNGF